MPAETRNRHRRNLAVNRRRRADDDAGDIRSGQIVNMSAMSNDAVDYLHLAGVSMAGFRRQSRSDFRRRAVMAAGSVRDSGERKKQGDETTDGKRQKG